MKALTYNEIVSGYHDSREVQILHERATVLLNTYILLQPYTQLLPLV
jgi:hypothetical protein